MTIGPRGRARSVRAWIGGERGFTLLEVMIGIVMLSMGLLVMAGVFPQGLALGLYGKEQTKATTLAQEKLEDIKQAAIPQGAATYLTSTIQQGNYDQSPHTPECFTYDGASVACTDASGFFTRHVQLQCWAWSPSTNQFVMTATPYTCPPTGYGLEKYSPDLAAMADPRLMRNGQWIRALSPLRPAGARAPVDQRIILATVPPPYVFRLSVAVHWLVNGQTVYVGTGDTRGCVLGGTVVPVGHGCVQVSEFFWPAPAGSP